MAQESAGGGQLSVPVQGRRWSADGSLTRYGMDLGPLRV